MAVALAAAAVFAAAIDLAFAFARSRLYAPEVREQRALATEKLAMEFCAAAREGRLQRVFPLRGRFHYNADYFRDECQYRIDDKLGVVAFRSPADSGAEIIITPDFAQYGNYLSYLLTGSWPSPLETTVGAIYARSLHYAQGFCERFMCDLSNSNPPSSVSGLPLIPDR